MTEHAQARLNIVLLVLFTLLTVWQAINASTESLRWAFGIFATVSAASVAYRVWRLRAVR